MEQYVKGFQRFHAGEDVRPVTSCKSDTCGWLKTIRIRCVWTRTFSHPQKNICGKKTFRIRVDMAFETAPTLLYAQPQPLISEAILVFLIA